jgi:hypothetical protein
MTQDGIIRMAREAGAYYAAIDEETGQEFLALTEDAFEHFAALVAAAEREACAEVCENLVLAHPGRADLTAEQCAAAIRARSQA